MVRVACWQACSCTSIVKFVLSLGRQWLPWGRAEQSQVSQFIVFKFTPRGSKGCVCVGKSERRGDRAMTEQGWIIEKTQDSTGHSQAHTLHKCKGEIHQEKWSASNHQGVQKFPGRVPQVPSLVAQNTDICVKHQIPRGAQAQVYSEDLLYYSGHIAQVRLMAKPSLNNIDKQALDASRGV